ncbi:MAG: hypothetical protein ACKO04_16135 [Actinomycetes bacterium]
MTADVEGFGAGAPPPDPRSGRFDRLAQLLQAAVVLVAVAAALGDLLPGPGAKLAGWVLLATLVAVPVLRVLWFVARWYRRGDPRFALVGTGVLLVMAAGVVLSR